MRNTEPIGDGEPVVFVDSIPPQESEMDETGSVTAELDTYATASQHGAQDVEDEPHVNTSTPYDGLESNPSFANLPRHLKPLAHLIRRLDPNDFLAISDMTQRVASRELYSLLPYTGSNWYLPEAVLVSEGEPQWGLQLYKDDFSVGITIAGRRVVLHFTSWLLRAAILCLFWYTLYNILPYNLMIRGGYVWDPLVTFTVAAVVGGTICRFLQIPPLVGVIWISIMWNNIPYVGYLTSGIDKNVSKIAQRVGLTIVLARAGFSLSLKSVKPHWQESLMLATLPFGVQAVVHALITKAFFGHDSNTWAFLEGLLCAPVSPAIVVPGVLFLQEQGYGLGRGPLSLQLSSVGIEAACGVWAVNFILGLLFDSTPLVQAIIMGPVQIIGGIIIGIVIGFLFHHVVERIKAEAKRLPNGHYAKDHLEGVMMFSFGIFLLFNAALVFFGYNKKLAGGGAIASIFFSATVAHMWIKDDTKEMLEHKAHYGRYLSNTWDVVVMPALFSMVGCQVVLKDLFNSTFTPKAIAVIAIATAARMLVIFAVQFRSPCNWKQKLIVCGGYSGKATLQAALGPSALSSVKTMILAQGATAELLVKKRDAENISNMALLSILIMAPTAALILTKLGPKVLDHQPRGS